MHTHSLFLYPPVKQDLYAKSNKKSNTFQDGDLCERAKIQIRDKGFSATVLPTDSGSKRSAHLVEAFDLDDYVEVLYI